MAQQVVESVIDKGVLKKVKTGNVSVFRPTIKIQTDICFIRSLSNEDNQNTLILIGVWKEFQDILKVFFSFSSLGNCSCYLKSFIGAIEFLKIF